MGNAKSQVAHLAGLVTQRQQNQHVIKPCSPGVSHQLLDAVAGVKRPPEAQRELASASSAVTFRWM